jgi:Peptidase A4 family
MTTVVVIWSHSGRRMLRTIAVAGCAILALLGAARTAFARSTKKLAKYALVQVVRDADGRPLMTADGQYVSSNWSGYVLPSFKTGETYTSVQATWVVPNLPFENTRKHASAQWVGIGGFCKDSRCNKVDQTLIQLGTAEVLGGPEDVYFAWHQIQPGPVFGTSLAVLPGDEITASISCNPCVGNQSWAFSMTDITSGKNWTAEPVPYQSSLMSAEFIEGASTGQKVVFPLANYGTVTIEQSIVNDSEADLTAGYGIVLRDSRASSTISPLNATADGFTACFEPHRNPAACSFIPLPP